MIFFWAILSQKTQFFDKMGQNGQKDGIYQKCVQMLFFPDFDLKNFIIHVNFL